MRNIVPWKEYYPAIHCPYSMNLKPCDEKPGIQVNILFLLRILQRKL